MYPRRAGFPGSYTADCAEKAVAQASAFVVFVMAKCKTTQAEACATASRNNPTGGEIRSIRPSSAVPTQTIRFKASRHPEIESSG